MNMEIEAKFLLSGGDQIGNLLSLLQAKSFEIQSVSAEAIDDRYFDTPDWRLLGEGWSYRWRDASGKREATLKSMSLNGQDVHKRREETQEVSAFPASTAQLPPGPVADGLGDQLNGKAPVELFRVSNYRRLYLARSGDARLEIAVDEATITAERQSKLAPGQMRFHELEIELKQGSEDSLLEVAELIREQLDVLPARLSKYQRGLQTAGYSVPAAAPASDRPPFRESDPVILLAYRYLQAQFQEMLLEEPRAWEGLDPEGVHQMRVATRRIRAALRAFREVLPGTLTGTLNSELRWLAAVLGEVRDLDVYLENLKHYASEVSEEDAAALSGYEAFLSNEWQKARRKLLTGLGSRRYQRLKERFGRVLDRGPSRGALRQTRSITIEVAAERLLKRRLKKVLKLGQAIGPRSPDEALHQLRIQGKRLRYLFEFFQPIYGRRLKRTIKTAKRLQTVLGDHQDACVATERLIAFAERVPMRPASRKLLVVLGQLISGQRRQVQQKRLEFRMMWAKLSRKELRRQVKGLFRGHARHGTRTLTAEAEAGTGR